MSVRSARSSLLAAATVTRPDAAAAGRVPSGQGLHVVFFTSSFPVGVGGVDMVLVRRARELARYAGVTAVVPTPWVPRSSLIIAGSPPTSSTSRLLFVPSWAITVRGM